MTLENIKQSTHVRIIEGPPKFNLMVALFDEGNGINDRRVRFGLAQNNVFCELPLPRPYQVDVLISQIGREDGSGNRWLFEGSCGEKRCKGYFDTQTRKGWIEVIPTSETTPKEAQPTKIVLTIRPTNQDDIHAAMNGDNRLWDCGATANEAIGSLISTHGEKIGIRIEWNEHDEYTQRQIAKRGWR